MLSWLLCLTSLLFAAQQESTAPERWPPRHDIPQETAAQTQAQMGETWTTEKDWRERRTLIREHVRNITGLDRLPEPGPLSPVIHDRIDGQGYSVESFFIETFPGFFASGNLYRPLDREGPFPIVLCPHGHARANATQPEGRFRAEYQRLCATLARMGAIVLTWDMVGWGEQEQVTHRRPESTTLQTFNTMRMIDFAQSMQDADPERIGITGSSGGGTQTFLATMLDDRIDGSIPVVMVSTHFFGGCACESGLPIHQSAQHKTNNVEFAACAAPRPTMLISVGGDWTLNTPKVEFPYLQRVYSTLGAPESCANVHLVDEEHDYGVNKRSPAYRFLGHHLGLDIASVTAPDGSIDETAVAIQPRKDLRAFTDNHPRPEHALQGDAAVDQAWQSYLEQ